MLGKWFETFSLDCWKRHLSLDLRVAERGLVSSGAVPATQQTPTQNFQGRRVKRFPPRVFESFYPFCLYHHCYLFSPLFVPIVRGELENPESANVQVNPFRAERVHWWYFVINWRCRCRWYFTAFCTSLCSVLKSWTRYQTIDLHIQSPFHPDMV